MKILVDLINYPKGTHGHDWRYATLVPMCHQLEKMGHVIYINAMTGTAAKPFCKWKGEKDLDHYIVYVTYNNATQEAVRQSFFKRGKKATMYDHGWLPRSMVMDRNKRFGDTWYYNRIRDLVKQCPNPTIIEPYRLELLKGNLSKRPQKRVDKIPDVDYVFIPGQVLYDSSVVHYSKTGLIKLIIQVVEWAAKNKLHVIYKPHPGLSHFAAHGKQILYKFSAKLKQQYKHFHVVNTSVFDLMQKARFTACVNSGSVIDNIVSHTPCYCCGKSFFSNSGTIVFNENVQQGLDKMYARDYDWKEMKMQQLRMLWWLKEHMVQECLSPEENVRRLSYHSGVNFMSPKLM